MGMTLEEAIWKEKALAYSFRKRIENMETTDPTPLEDMEKEHLQYAEWLRELKAYQGSPVLQRWLKQCDTCKHESKRASEAPCKSCCHTFKNKHEEVNDDAKTEDT